MTEELHSYIEQLTLKRGDVVGVFTRPNITPDEVVALQTMLGELGNDLQVLFIIMAEGDCLRKLPEDVMNTYGWYRK